MTQDIKPAAKEPNTLITETPENSESSSESSQRDLPNAIWTIVCGVALPSIPILIVTTFLLYVIFRNRVIPNQNHGWPQFRLPPNAIAEQKKGFLEYIQYIRENGGAPAYYVNYNPSTITTIASWTSRVIPYLSSSIMAMVAFFAASHIVRKSQNGEFDQLPDSNQMMILIGLLGGSGMGPMKDALAHSWRMKRVLSAPLPAAFTALFCITFVGLLIPVFDTWFGVSVQPAAITQLTNTSTSAWHSFGREFATQNALSPNCTQTNPGLPALDPGNLRASWWWPCNLYLPLHEFFLVGSGAAQDILQGSYSNNILLNYTGPPETGGSGASAKNTTIYLMGDPHSSAAVDFQADTMGISTSCQIMTADCNVYLTDLGLNFACPKGFAGNFYEPIPDDYDPQTNSYTIGGPNTGIGFATDAMLSNYSRTVNFSDGHATDGMPAGSEGSIIGLLTQNPVFFGTWATGYLDVFDAESPLLKPVSGMNDPQLFPDGSSDASWLLNCSATIYDITYTFVNGSLHNLRVQEAPPDWGAFFTAPLAWAQYLPEVKTAMGDAANKAVYLAQNSSDVADIWADEFSKMALAFSIGLFGPRLNDAEQLRDNYVLVTRVPMIPLYCLLFLKFLYVVVVIILALGVYCFTHPAETEVIRELLSVKGLAMAHFSDPGRCRAEVVGQLQSQLGSFSSEATIVTESAMSSMPQQEHAGEQTKMLKVGCVRTSEGRWTFALIAQEVWQSVKPIVNVVVMQEAKANKLGVFGDAYVAWKN
ncbi:hypothetical protein N0V93_004568 [Gnomoniopsis smithogilvyi]|uniref:Uncharacterized protein n=1 Tax=Gnomoniopsis smithogilvyi TaxID=1191159 RepID=A0A9W8YRQ7_9PEZI|nr:hypothetical protein N0V93_004568 [Gnomoniopsis smithogilvyi]